MDEELPIESGKQKIKSSVLLCAKLIAFLIFPVLLISGSIAIVPMKFLDGEYAMYRQAYDVAHGQIVRKPALI